MIRFEAVSKKFPDGTVAVDNLDLEAPTGKLTALVGPSGCGKTTTLRMINRLIAPTSGRIMLDDDDTADLDPAVLRRGIGYVIQHAGLFPHRTVLGNVTAVPRLLGWTKSTAEARAKDLLERVGLEPSMATRYPAQLSGGQQQRVGVARALAADPPVMLMDEPFSAVDPIVRAQLQDEFLRLQADLEKTIVLVTHDIDEAIKLGDSVAVFAEGGRIAQMAEPDTLLSRPANDFVAGFVGRDRGYRALGFRQSAGLPLHTEPTVRPGTSWREAAHASLDHWILIVDGDDRPLGWTDLDRPAGDTIERTTMNLGGTLANSNGAVREALDAALSSPSGRGVVVDGSGRFVGTILASEVVAELSNTPEAVGAGKAVIAPDAVERDSAEHDSAERDSAETGPAEWGTVS